MMAWLSGFILAALTVFSVRDQGARGDGQTDDAAAIQRAIDACSAAGGGRVVVPRGTYLSYRLSLRDNVELHLAKDAVILGGTDGQKYKLFEPTGVWRTEYSPRFNRRAFFYTVGATNVAITGAGVIDGNAGAFHAWSSEANRWKRISDTNLTGRCVFFVGCRDVRVEGVTIRNPTGWATWFLDCDNLAIRDLRIRCDSRFMNGDGIHLGGCRDVLVTGCDVQSEDDALILRSHQEAMREPRALERVIVSNCVLRANRPDGIRLGWSGDGPLRDILVTHCTIPHSGVGIECRIPPINRLKNIDPPRRYSSERGNSLARPAAMLPFALENVRFENLEVYSLHKPYAISVFDPETYTGDVPVEELEETPISAFRDVVFRNCRFHSAGKPIVERPKKLKVDDWRFENCAYLPSDWPVLKTYEGAALRRVKMPMGGIGTGTISLSGRGSLVDWELGNRPAKGNIPVGLKAPHFAIRYRTAGGVKAARLLEGPLDFDEYEGDRGCPVVNQGFPRFDRAVFKAAYPLAQIDLSDRDFLLAPRLEAFNPLVPGDADSSGIPAVLFRWVVTNPTAEPLSVSIAGSIVRDNNTVLTVAPDASEVTRATDIREPGWNVGVDRYWRTFLEKGIVADTPTDDTTAKKSCKANQLCVRFGLAPGETRKVSFVLAWRNPRRMAWDRYDSKSETDVVGNWYCTRYATAKAAADDLLARLPELEAKTVDFVRSVLARNAPDVIKEAALFNLSTLRSETCFRTSDGHFFAWEGCKDHKGSCLGSCTHVWGYEHCLVDLWPDLARDMVELQFGPALDPSTGHMNFRIPLPLSTALAHRGKGVAAADGQMQCIVKAYEVWKKAADEAWLKGLWPNIRKAMAFCWVPGGWDADRDGVMEGCQHNTMDVEYFGPNPQMEFLYLAALEACEAMATACADADFATTCRALREKGSAWTEANLFNGRYYEHQIVPPKGPIAEGLRHTDSGAKDLANPDYQLGAGCLIDQLLGDYAARAVGLAPVVDRAHGEKTLATILEKCRKSPTDKTFNCMRGFALAGETSLRMAWYPPGRLPRSPFPYYSETMTGFEYVVAALLAMNGDQTAAEQVVRDIRDRYDGVKRNPFDEAECGHHYARALAAWTVLQAWAPNNPHRR